MPAMKYCLGSESRSGAGGLIPTGMLHAVLFADAYESVAVCGERVIAWPGKSFASSSSNSCTVCRNFVDGSA